MKRLSLVGEQVCRTFTANNFATEIHRTVVTTDIEKERQYMDLKRKIEAVRFIFRPSLIGSLSNQNDDGNGNVTNLHI